VSKHEVKKEHMWKLSNVSQEICAPIHKYDVAEANFQDLNCLLVKILLRVG
jgi:hypothetical protein